MKKLLSLILCMALLLALLTVGAAAYNVVLSPQKLMVNGQYYDCEKYNIDGSNYFKLRDLAYLLMGTDAEFGVSFSAEENSVMVVPGMPYDPNGSELVIGADKSASAVPSSQYVWIMGTDSDGLSIYNIGGNNFFKLRDLGKALGFLVDYDQATDTAVVMTADYADSPVGNVDQLLAFDRIWAWVQDRYTFAAGDDLYYLMDNIEWDDGDITEYWLADVTHAGAPALMLRSLYLFPDGSAGESRLYLTREGRPYDGEYLYYFDFGAAISDADADFCGTLTVDPAAFDAHKDVTFTTFTEGASPENLSIASGNMTLAVASLVTCFREFIDSEPALDALTSAYDFGFTAAAMEE